MNQHPPRTLRVAMIGDGLMAKEHSIAWRNVNAIYGDLEVRPELATIVHPDADRAATAAVRYEFAGSATDWREVVDDPKIDVVNIVTPNAAHHDVAVAAAANGKHIWCEKPLAPTATEARAMVDAAELNGVTTLVGFTYVHNPAVALAKRLIDDGELGDIISFDGAFRVDTMIDPTVPYTWRTDRRRAGSGALGDLGSHMIALARHLVGPIAEVAAINTTVVTERHDVDGRLHSVDNDDQSISLLRFAAGFGGTMHASRVATGSAFDVSLTITGTRGAVRFDQQTNHRVEVSLASDEHESHGFRTIEIGAEHGDFGALWPMSGINVGLHELKLFELRRFIDALTTGRRELPDFREALAIQETVEAIERAGERGSWEPVQSVGEPPSG